MLETMIWGVLRVAATLLLLMGVVVALRDASAATRHAVWRAGFVVALLLPLVAMAMPWKLNVLPGGTFATTVEAPAPGVPTTFEVESPAAPTTLDPIETHAPEAALGEESGELAPPADAEVATVTPSRSFDVTTILLLVWLAGAPPP